MIRQPSFSHPLGSRSFVHKRIGGLVRKGAGFAVRTAGRFLAGSPGGQIVQALVPTQPRGPVRRTQVIPAPTVFPQPRSVAIVPPVLPTVGAVAAGPRSLAEFQAVAGAFGLPAMVPVEELRRHLECPRGMVLGQDELCYPKQVLRRNSKFRKWHSGPRPPISAADAKMFRRLKAAQETLKAFGKVANMKVTKG